MCAATLCAPTKHRCPTLIFLFATSSFWYKSQNFSRRFAPSDPQSTHDYPIYTTCTHPSATLRCSHLNIHTGGVRPRLRLGARRLHGGRGCGPGLETATFKGGGGAARDRTKHSCPDVCGRSKQVCAGQKMCAANLFSSSTCTRVGSPSKPGSRRVICCASCAAWRHLVC